MKKLASGIQRSALGEPAVRFLGQHSAGADHEVADEQGEAVRVGVRMERGVEDGHHLAPDHRQPNFGRQPSQHARQALVCDVRVVGDEDAVDTGLVAAVPDDAAEVGVEHNRPAAWAEQAGDLGDRARDPRNIFEALERHRGIERAVGQTHGRHVGLCQFDRGKASTAGPGKGQHRRAQVETVDAPAGADR
nr:hypothetical protein [Geminicoccus flavidas]